MVFFTILIAFEAVFEWFSAAFPRIDSLITSILAGALVGIITDYVLKQKKTGR